MSNCSIKNEARARRGAALFILLAVAAAIFLGVRLGMFIMAVKIGSRLGL